MSSGKGDLICLSHSSLYIGISIEPLLYLLPYFSIYQLSAKYLQGLVKPPSTQPDDGNTDWPSVEILGRAKDEAENKKLFEQIAKEIQTNVRVHSCHKLRKRKTAISKLNLKYLRIINQYKTGFCWKLTKGQI